MTPSHLSSSTSTRIATLDDAQAILGIYAPYIERTAVTFETEIPSLEEIRRRIETNARYGWLVASHGSEVIGYAYASKHRERAAYQWCCELSAYVREGHHRQGIASALYLELIRDLATRGFVNAYAGLR